jgi:hypothetical protein
MPSGLHDSFVELIKHDPELAAVLLAGSFGLEMPAFAQARVDATDLSELVPKGYHADVVAVFADRSGRSLRCAAGGVGICRSRDRELVL